jgi:hypothetical protein
MSSSLSVSPDIILEKYVHRYPGFLIDIDRISTLYEEYQQKV